MGVRFLVEPAGLEPANLPRARRALSQLSYGPFEAFQFP